MFKNRVNCVCVSVKYVSHPFIVTVFAARLALTLVEEVSPLATMLVRSLVTGMSEGKVKMTRHPASMGRPSTRVRIPEDS